MQGHSSELRHGQVGVQRTGWLGENRGFESRHRRLSQRHTAEAAFAQLEDLERMLDQGLQVWSGGWRRGELDPLGVGEVTTTSSPDDTFRSAVACALFAV